MPLVTSVGRFTTSTVTNTGINIDIIVDLFKVPTSPCCVVSPRRYAGIIIIIYYSPRSVDIIFPELMVNNIIPACMIHLEGMLLAMGALVIEPDNEM